MKQSTHVGLCILVPLLCGCTLTAVASWMPIFLQYSSWVDSAISEIVNNELAVIFNVSFHVASHSGFFMQTPANFILLISSLIETYYAGRLLIKPDFRGLGNYASAVELAQQNTSGFNYSLSMWYLTPTLTDPQQLPPASQEHLYESAVFDSFARPTVNPSDVNRGWQVWYGFASDGFTYTIPAAAHSFWLNYNGDPECPYNRARPPQYDPRCRAWFKQTSAASSRYIPTVTDPYMVLWSHEIGQSVCSGFCVAMPFSLSHA